MTKEEPIDFHIYGADIAACYTKRHPQPWLQCRQASLISFDTPEGYYINVAGIYGKLGFYNSMYFETAKQMVEELFPNNLEMQVMFKLTYL